MVVVAVGLGGFGVQLAADQREATSEVLRDVAAALVGALVILIAIERRVRPEDVSWVRWVFRDGVWILLQPRLRRSVGWANRFKSQLAVMRPKDFVGRDRELEQINRPGNVAIVGAAATGKTVLAIAAALYQVAKFLGSPRSEQLPVIMRMREHIHATLEANVWYEGFRSVLPMPSSDFLV